MNPLWRLDYLLFWGAALVVAGGVLAWLSARRLGRRLRTVVVLLRVLALLALLLVALNPGRWMSPPESGTASCAVLVDRSGSMAVADVAGGSRLDAAREAVLDACDSLDSPEKVEIFSFADDFRRDDTSTLRAAKATGGPTDILGAADLLLNRFSADDSRLLGIVLVSDGRQVAASSRSDLAMRIRSAALPLVCVPVGGSVEQPDLAIRALRRLVVAFGDQRVRVSCMVSNRAMGETRVEVRLVDGSDAVIAAEKVTIGENREHVVTLELPSRAPGFEEYDLEVVPWEGESSVLNNSARVAVATLESRMRVLLVEGTPYWDSKFLVQLLRAQEGMQVTAIYRLSADRFFRVETVTSEAQQIEGDVFPSTLAELQNYDVVVFGKGVEYVLTPARVQLLRTYLSDHGGCVLFARGKPYVGVFEELEAIEPVVWGGSLGGEVRGLPTSVGRDVGLFGSMLPDVDDAVWKTLPPMRGCYQVASLDGFAQVLLSGRSATGSGVKDLPLLIGRRLGRGHVLTMNADGLWRWNFSPKNESISELYEEMWIQLLYWSVSHGDFLPGHAYAMRMNPSVVAPGHPVHVVASFRGDRTLPGPPSLKVKLNGAPAGNVELAPSGDGTQWDGYLAYEQPGVYDVELVDGETGLFSGTRGMFEVDALPAEEDDLSADPAMLASLADAAGGRVVTLHDLPAVLSEMTADSDHAAIAGQAVWDPLWDRAWLLVAFALLVAGEWTLRRRSGLL